MCEKNWQRRFFMYKQTFTIKDIIVDKVRREERYLYRLEAIDGSVLTFASQEAKKLNDSIELEITETAGNDGYSIRDMRTDKFNITTACFTNDAKAQIELSTTITNLLSISDLTKKYKIIIRNDPKVLAIELDKFLDDFLKEKKKKYGRDISDDEIKKFLDGTVDFGEKLAKVKIIMKMLKPELKVKFTEENIMNIYTNQLKNYHDIESKKSIETLKAKNNLSDKDLTNLKVQSYIDGIKLVFETMNTINFK